MSLASMILCIYNFSSLLIHHDKNKTEIKLKKSLSKSSLLPEVPKVCETIIMPLPLSILKQGYLRF